MLIRPLDKTSDLNAVVRFYADAPDFWELVDGQKPGATKAAAFFNDLPPNCDESSAHQLGLFLGDRLSGIGNLCFGFPEPRDAYIGLMMLGPWARNEGRGKVLLSQLENIAKRGGASNLYLAVWTINPKGRAFWEREGFSPTGLSGKDEKGREAHRLVKRL